MLPIVMASAFCLCLPISEQSSKTDGSEGKEIAAVAQRIYVAALQVYRS